MKNFTRKQEVDEAIEKCAEETYEKLWGEFDSDTYRDEGYFEPFKLWNPYIHPLAPQWKIFFCLEIHHMERHDGLQNIRMIVQRVVNQGLTKSAKSVVDWGDLNELVFNWRDEGLKKRVLANFRLMLEEVANIYYDEADDWDVDNWDEEPPHVKLGYETFNHDEE